MSIDGLESESIEIFREAVAGAGRPVLMYSAGKDSSVLLHVARKAFHPAPPPFPLLHIDTTWKFRAMYVQRDRAAKDAGMRLLVHTNTAALAAGVNPFTHGSSYYTDQMKTVALRQALDAHGFDVIFGGARRDEEASRAKERICSFRSAGHRWNPKAQRPELWSIYNMRLRPGETMRVFPLSNWTELDIWRYIARERIAVVPLYFAQERDVVVRGGQLIPVGKDTRYGAGETPQRMLCRFRTLGCYPCTGAVSSSASTVEEIIGELEQARRSERTTRIIDFDSDGSMEQKKREGYF